MSDRFDGKVVALCGGVGGARMAAGLASVLDPAQLTCIVNVGDDFTHLGLRICPDLDTVLYTLAGLENPATGWGRKGETWSFMDSLRAINGPDWFLLGDKDLGVHVMRTDRLAKGDGLTRVTADLAAAFGVGSTILPVTDDTVATLCDTDEGRLDFQDYFVRRRCEPALRGLIFQGAASARPGRQVTAALTDPDLALLVICPSNPFLSIDPMLAIPGLGDMIGRLRCPRVAVSPIVGGAAVKGPLAKIMAEMGVAVTPETIARRYRGIADTLLVAPQDATFDAGPIRIVGCDVMMRDPAGRARLARDVLRAAQTETAR